MFFRKGVVRVHQIPSEISSANQMEWLQRLEASAENGDPRFVLDCSRLEHIGASEIRFLLCCLEEVMKHNGDVRLAKLRPEVQLALRRAGVDRVLEMYETTESAISSYQLCPADSLPPIAIAEEDRTAEYAA